MASGSAAARSPPQRFVAGSSPPAAGGFTAFGALTWKYCDSSLLEVQAVPRREAQVVSKDLVEGAGNTTGFAPESRLHESTYREKIHQEVVRVLLEGPPSLQRATLPDGSVPGVALFKASQSLRSLCFNSLACLFRAGQGRNSSWQFWSQVDINPIHRTVRLRSAPEQLLLLAEVCFHRAAADRGISPSRLTLPLADIAGHPDVQRCLQRSCFRGPFRVLPSNTDAVPFLRSVLADAETLVCKQIQDADYVTLQSPAHLLCQCVHELLLTWKAGVILAREGEVPLSWVAEQPQVQAALSRTGLPSAGEAALRALRDAILDGPSGLELEGAGNRASIRFASCPSSEQSRKLFLAPSGFSESTLSCRQVLFADAGPEKLQHSAQCIQGGGTLDNRQKNLRGLLGFYFQPFNLQHNRLLMSLVKQQYQGPAHTLHFTLAELEALPRIRRWVERWLGQKGPAARRAVLASVLQADDGDSEGDADEVPGGLPFPVQLREGVDCEVLELTYEPQLRLCVEVPPTPAADRAAPALSPLREQLEQLLPDVAASASTAKDRVGAGAARVVTVVSYSVSSDLSHGQSPKATAFLDATLDGRLDPEAVSWESRLKQLSRELRHYNADIICLQGLQSIGLSPRCSEKDVAWFSLQEEPAANHLVHLYRVLSRDNYGVAFSPTLLLPGSKTISLGNAIFWKRSRWLLVQQESVSSHAVRALLQSRANGWQILACSMKGIINYAREWGGEATEQELLSPLEDVDAQLRSVALGAGAAKIWGMDVGCPPHAVHAALGLAMPGQAPTGESAWRNSHTAPGLPSSFWTSSGGHALVTDYILHDGSLRPWAVLGPRLAGADPVKLFEDGFPSDHLLLMAILVASRRQEDDRNTTEVDTSVGNTSSCATQGTVSSSEQLKGIDCGHGKMASSLQTSDSRSDTHPSPASSQSAQSWKAVVFPRRVSFDLKHDFKGSTVQ